MFLVNSRLGLFSVSIYLINYSIQYTEPLIPKLQGHFAEFLNEGSLDRLRIFSSPTCVSFGTATCVLVYVTFLGSMITPTSAYAPHHRSHITSLYMTICTYDLALTPSTGIGSPSPSYTYSQSENLRTTHSTGILTCCPSTTPFGLALGPTNPGRIYLPQETFSFRRIRFSLILSLLIPAYSLPVRPGSLSVTLLPTLERSPTTHFFRNASAVSVASLVPQIFGANVLD